MVKKHRAAVDNAYMLAMLWATCGLGLLALTTGVVSLLLRQVFPWLRSRVRWQPWAWSNVMFGLFLMVESVPRLAGTTPGWALGFSLVAFVPLAAFVDLSMRARLRRR